MYAWMLILGTVGAPFAALSRNATYVFMKLYCRNILWLLRILCGVETEVRGVVPSGDVVVVSKHQSFLDVILHMRFLGRAQFVMKRELAWIPVFGFYAMRIGCTPINRKLGARAAEQMERGVAKSAGAETQTVIYPQGTRVPPGERRRYRSGASLLYSRQGKTCVLAATNAGVFWPRFAVYRRPGKAVLEYLGTVPSGLSRDDFMELVEQRIEDASDQLISESGVDIPGVFKS